MSRKAPPPRKQARAATHTGSLAAPAPRLNPIAKWAFPFDGPLSTAEGNGENPMPFGASQRESEVVVFEPPLPRTRREVSALADQLVRDGTVVACGTCRGRGRERCSSCNGSGLIQHYQIVPATSQMQVCGNRNDSCPRCGGTGQFLIQEPERTIIKPSPCSGCDGRGLLWSNCDTCSGHGVLAGGSKPLRVWSVLLPELARLVATEQAPKCRRNAPPGE
jgi:hypothetical protein